MRIKHSGQMAAPMNPKNNAGVFHAEQAKRAMCLCGGPKPPIAVELSNRTIVTKGPVSGKRRTLRLVKEVA